MIPTMTAHIREQKNVDGKYEAITEFTITGSPSYSEPVKHATTLQPNLDAALTNVQTAALLCGVAEYTITVVRCMDGTSGDV